MHQEQFSSNIFNQCKTIFEHLTQPEQMEASKATLTGIVRKYAGTGVIKFPQSLLEGLNAPRIE